MLLTFVHSLLIDYVKGNFTKQIFHYNQNHPLIPFRMDFWMGYNFSVWFMELLVAVSVWDY